MSYNCPCDHPSQCNGTCGDAELHAATTKPQPHKDGNVSPIDENGWQKVPEEPSLEFLKSINIDNQVLAYENGRYYNAWFAFDEFEGGWYWTDEADSEPNPSHFMPLPKPPSNPFSALLPEPVE